MSGGRPGASSASCAFTASTTLTTLVPDCFWTIRLTAFLSFRRARLRGSATPFSTRPMSRTRIGRPSQVATIRSAKAGDVLHAAHGAQHQLAAALVDAAAGDLDVLRPQRVAHLLDRESGRPPAVGVDEDVDRALPAADQDHRADAAARSRCLLDLLLGDLGDLAQVAVAGDDDAHDRRRVDVELLHDRRVGALGQARDDGRRPCRAPPAPRPRRSCSSRNCTMTTETPSLVVERSSSMPSIVLTISSIGLVTPLSISSTLAPLSVVVMVTIGKSTFGKRSRPRRWNENQPRTTSAMHEHGREDRAADAEVGERHGVTCAAHGVTVTGAPCSSLSRFEIATCSPAFTPSAISRRSSSGDAGADDALLGLAVRRPRRAW